jgi:hypothetical protein
MGLTEKKSGCAWNSCSDIFGIIAEIDASFARGISMLKDMKSYAHLKPGQKGTRWLVERIVRE